MVIVSLRCIVAVCYALSGSWKVSDCAKKDTEATEEQEEKLKENEAKREYEQTVEEIINNAAQAEREETPFTPLPRAHHTPPWHPLASPALPSTLFRPRGAGS